MTRWTAALVAAMALLLAGCPADDAPIVAPPAEPDWEVCVNDQDGYELHRPPLWYVNEAEVLPPCRLFDPEPIEVAPGEEIPLEIAVIVTVEPMAFEQAIGDRPGTRVIDSDETTLQGRRVVREEVQATEGAERRPPDRWTTRWVVDLPGDRVLVASTDQIATPVDYAQRQQVLDRMMDTVVITEMPSR